MPSLNQKAKNIEIVLKQFRLESKNPREHGTKFESLMKKALLKDPSIAGKFDKIYFWKDFPYKNNLDTGIDLVGLQNNQYVAIQCKCYNNKTYLKDISTFTTKANTIFRSKNKDMSYSRMILISTTDKITPHAEKNFLEQKTPTSIVLLSNLKKSQIDWPKLALGKLFNIEKKDIKSRPYQQQAIDACIKGFKKADRGKLIMACGTGKTFTSLKLTETFAKQGDFILFLVPSISLMSQTIREWLQETNKTLQTFAVCSDKTVSKKSKEEEDIKAYELPYYATTNIKHLKEQITQADTDKPINVIFSTYQSIDVIILCQKQKILPTFNLTICDEAHRTTGFKAQKIESHFTKVHNHISSRKRLYMTATPRIYKAQDKDSIKIRGGEYYSMDEQKIYGDVFYEYGFSKAVNEGFLSDYKVLILTISDKAIPKAQQKDLTNQNQEIEVSDRAKIIGCYQGLRKKWIDKDGDVQQDKNPMKRAVAFTRTIKDSETLVDKFSKVIEEENIKSNFECHTQHIDGSMSSGERDKKIDWLKTEGEDNECKILFNARCLSEGVDVPSLDSVIFLNPKKSTIDIVQSVGRVMRKCEGKKYGYVIIPVVIPLNKKPSEALKDNEKYKIIWQVMQALRSHDQSLKHEINTIEFNKNSKKIQIINAIGKEEITTEQSDQLPFEFYKWQDAIYAKLVLKCGERLYWDDWAKNVGEIASNHVLTIENLLKKTVKKQEYFGKFINELKQILNPSITQKDAIKMISQHLISKPIFDSLFPNSHIFKNNLISKSLDTVIKNLELKIKQNTSSLDSIYKSIKKKASGINSLEGKQRLLKELYSKFFEKAFPKDSSKLGIVYTPLEIVDFMIHSVEHILNKEFNESLNDKNLNILEPFAGTGIFITRLLQSGIIKSKNLIYKYENDIHTNEILLLSYYISQINIAETFFEISGLNKPFSGGVLTDSFHEKTEYLKSKHLFPVNFKKLQETSKKDFRVIIGNPPYSVGQKSANNANQNNSYHKVEQRIRDTYNKRSKASKCTGDSYIKALRWASDNLQNKGVLAFIHNGSLLDGIGTDGLRACLEQEFMNVYCLNLRGEARGRGSVWKKEGGKIFGSRSRVSACISFFVKNTSQKNKKATIYYHDIGDYLTQEDKLNSIKEFCSIEKTPWKIIKPNKHYDWINQRDLSYETYPTLGDKKIKNTNIIFDIYSCGILTSRDAWAYNFCKDKLTFNMKNMMRVYNSKIKNLQNKIDFSQYNYKTIDKHIIPVIPDSTKISWSHGLKQAFLKKTTARFNNKKIITSSYRPFTKKYLYFDKMFNERVSLNPKIWFDNQDIYQSQKNKIICVSGRGAKQFSVLMTDHMPDYQYINNTQSFPLYYFDKTGTKQGGINDASLSMFQSHYINTSITKEDIFYYIYGILHAKTYQNKYKDNLLKDLSRIPLYKDFKTFANIGRELDNLHINYEKQPAPKEIKLLKQEKQILISKLTSSELKVTKMKFLKKDKSTIIYNSEIRITNIPKEAYAYKINNRSAIETVMENYKMKKPDKNSGIENNPNNPEDPRYILKLLLSVIAVSLKTNDLINQLSNLNFNILSIPNKKEVIDLNLLKKRTLIFTMMSDDKLLEEERKQVVLSYKKITGYMLPKSELNSHIRAFNENDWSKDSLLDDFKSLNFSQNQKKELLMEIVNVIVSDRELHKKEHQFSKDIAKALNFSQTEFQKIITLNKNKIT